MNPTNAVFNDKFMEVLVQEFHDLQSRRQSLSIGDRTYTSIYEYLCAKHDLDVTGDGLRKRLQRYRQRVADNEIRLTIEENAKEIQELVTRIKEEAEDEFPDELYDSIPSHLTDEPRILKFIDDWKKTQTRPMRVMVISDIHFPDHNTDVLRLHAEVAKRIQPDLIIFIGDQYDFDLISHWGVDMRRRGADIFSEVETPWNEFLEALFLAVSPATVFIAFDGNHEERLWKKMGEWSAIASTIEERFVSLVRGNRERVWYLNGSQELAIGKKLKLMHGTLASANTTNAMLAKEGTYGFTTVQGHVHRPQISYYRSDTAEKGDYRIVQAMVVGCSCNIPPHYYRKTNSPKQWLNGIGIIDVHPNDTFLNLQNIVYHQTPDNLTAVIGADIISVDLVKARKRVYA